MKSYRTKIVELANWWAFPGEYKPSAEELIDFFQTAGTEAYPTMKDAEYALKWISTGVKVQGKLKQWCGVFACAVVRDAGLTQVKWSLVNGRPNLTPVSGNKGMQPGDIAVVVDYNHHFLVTHIDYSTNTMHTVEGNTTGQVIRARKRRTTEPYAHYRIPA